MEVTQTLIDQFYKDVEQLGLKFPVAAISKATGYSKGNVSAYLSKKDEPSGNFLKKFYEAFPKSSTNVPRGTVIDNLAESNKVLAEANRTLADAHKIIARNNDELVQIVRASLEQPLRSSISQPVGEKSKAWLVEKISSLDNKKVTALADFLSKLTVEKTGKSVDGRR